MSVSPASGPASSVFTFSIVVDPGTKVVAGPVKVVGPIPPQLTDAQLLTPFGGKHVLCGRDGMLLVLIGLYVCTCGWTV